LRQPVGGFDDVGVRDEITASVNEPAGTGLDERRWVHDDWAVAQFIVTSASTRTEIRTAAGLARWTASCTVSAAAGSGRASIAIAVSRKLKSLPISPTVPS